MIISSFVPYKYIILSDSLCHDVMSCHILIFFVLCFINAKFKSLVTYQRVDIRIVLYLM